METKHHRKPRSIGGTDCTENISYVPVKQHRAWHHLVGNMSAPQIAIRLGTLFPNYYFLAVPNRYMTTIKLPLTYSTAKSKSLIDKSIKILWGSNGMRYIVNNINHRWIDTDFTIVHLKKVSP